jgi:hypothetical protein
MKTNEFVKIIKQVIREEVKKAVRDELNSFLTEVYKPTAVKKKAPVMAPNPVKKTMPQSKANNFDSYGPLGGLLQETAANMSSADFNDWGDMGTYTSADAGSSLAHVMGEDDLPDSSTNSLIKDYSAVLKAAEMHAKGGS